MNILICDDMPNETQKLASLLNDSGFDINTAIFHDGYKALNYIRSGAVVDACFLDILMPEMSGVALAEQLRADGFAGAIVFLTTSNEYAAESYGVKAFSYLLKPTTPDSVRSVLLELENAQKNSDNEGILLKISGIAKFIRFRDISYIEVIQHKVYFRLTDGNVIEIYTTFKEIAPQLLSDKRFVQCHRSYIVNMSDIAMITDRNITMQSGVEIPISRSFPKVRHLYFNWLFGENRI